MGMTQGDRQGIRGIGLRNLSQAQQYLDHVLHLLFRGVTFAYRGLFDLVGSVFKDPEVLQGTCRDDCATRLSELQGRIGVPVHEYLFYRHFIRTVPPNQLCDLFEDRAEFLRQFRITDAYAAMGDMRRMIAVNVDDAVAGDEGARINAKDAGH
jgi:hypothetical protein